MHVRSQWDLDVCHELALLLLLCQDKAAEVCTRCLHGSDSSQLAWKAGLGRERCGLEWVVV